MAYELETTFHLYPESGNYMYRVSPDGDGIGMIEIAYFDNVKDKEPESRMCIDRAAVPLLVEALKHLMTEEVE